MTDAQHGHTGSSIGDDRLITRVRGGDADAYAALYERHRDAARGLARQLVRGETEVDDVVSEAFARVLGVVQRGGGPHDGFRAYLLTCVRNAAYDRFRGEKRQVVTDDMESFDRGLPFADPALEGLERSLIARAFLSLPQRWQAVLWHTEIEGEKPAAVADVLGMSANSVAALAYRAREGLRQAYLQMHLAGGAAAESCRPALGSLGAYVRGGLAKRDTAMVDRHLDGCGDCRAVYAELTDVNVGLRGIIAPLFVGPAAAGYLAALPGGALAGGWWGRLPKRQQQAVAGGTAAAVVAASVALALVSNEEAAPPEPAAPPVAAEPVPPRADGEPEAPPAAPAPPREEPPAPAAPPPVPVLPEQPVVLPPEALPSPPAPGPSPSPPEPEPEEPPAVPVFAASIDPVGSLVPGRPGIVVLNVSNGGGPTDEDVVADVLLPPGVTLAAAGRAGSAFAVAPADPATSDGWSCVATDGGAECVRTGLDTGQDSTTYLDVAVASDAAEGGVPAVSVSSGAVTAAAEGARGVDSTGGSARYATVGQVRTLAVGNSLLTCEDADTDEWGGWPWSLWPLRAPVPGDERPAPALGLAPDGAGTPSGAPSAPHGSATPTPPTASPTPGGAPASEPDASTSPDPAASPDPTPSAAPSPGSAPDGPCARALERTGDQRDNDQWDMRPLDLDGDSGTASSSSAVWDLPEGGAVRWAGLYFSGVGTHPGATAKVRGPGAPAYTEVRAREVTGFRLPGFPAYQAFADVTDLVRGQGGGEWWVADVPTETGYATYAGWSLVVVLEDPAAARGRSMVLDGAALVYQGDGMDFPLSGLLPEGVPATVDVVAFEGDADIVGDQVLLNGAPLTPLGGDRDPGNAFASSATGAVGPPLTFGTDVARFEATLPPTSRVSLTSDGDAYLPAAVAVTAPVRPR